MEELTRERIFAQAARKLREDFNEARLLPHAGARGAEGEAIVRGFLNSHLPKRFAAGCGFIIDRQDRVSRQTDVVVYDAHNCPIYLASDTAAIFPNDNVAAVVEVKSRLDKEKLFSAAENIAAAKALVKTRDSGAPGYMQGSTLGCVFAFECELLTEKMLRHYVDTIAKHGIGRHIDVIVVLDRAFYTVVARPPGEEGWAMTTIEGLGGPAAEGSHLAVASHDAGEETLDGFLRYLLFHLTFFRAIVPHPGFSLRKAGGEVLYFMSLTQETDPVKREAKLREYADEVRREFEAAKSRSDAS
jgi:hypothetical protein